MIQGYSKVFAVGHREVLDVFENDVVVEEKVDGSQFSFGILNGELQCRSHNAEVIIGHAGMFTKAVETVIAIKDKLHPEWIYRGEYLLKPKHNSLAYDRVPKNNIIIYDIDRGNQNYLSPEEKKECAESLGLECVPLFYAGKLSSIEQLEKYLDTVSILGGQKVEGVVVKNYAKITDDKKIMMAKFVSEHFKEVHQKAWKESNPSQKDLASEMIEKYRTEARWKKAAQHLREDGVLEGEMKDIPALMKSVELDTLQECEAEIKEQLFKYYWPKISRGITRGLPEWYKSELEN